MKFSTVDDLIAAMEILSLLACDTDVCWEDIRKWWLCESWAEAPEKFHRAIASLDNTGIGVEDCARMWIILRVQLNREETS